jgi:seryl-tRNA synthetase
MPHPDPQLAESVGNWIGFALIAWGALARRKKQTDLMVDDIDKTIESKVQKLTEQVKLLQHSNEMTQTLTAIQTDKINHLDGTMSAFSQRLDRFEEALPRAETVLEKVLNALERLKAGTLVEKPIAGSGGMVAIKKKEGT